MDEKRFEELFPEPEIVEGQRKRHAGTFFKHWARQLSPKTPWDFTQAIEAPVKHPHKKMLSLYITMGSTVAACFIIAIVLPNLSALLHMSEHTDTSMVTEIENDDEQNGEFYDCEEPSSIGNKDNRAETENTTVDSEPDNLTDKEDILVNAEDKNNGGEAVGKGQEKQEQNQKKESEKNGKKQEENKKNEEKQELSHQEKNEKNEKEQELDRKEENKNKDKPSKGQSKVARPKDNNTSKNNNVQPENTDKTLTDNANSVSGNDVSAENTQEIESINNSAPITGSSDDSAPSDFGNKNDATDDSAFEDTTEEAVDTVDTLPDMPSETDCYDSPPDYSFDSSHTNADTSIDINDINTSTNPSADINVNTNASIDIDDNMEDICVDDCMEIPLKKDVAAYAYLYFEATWYVKKGILKPWGEESEYSYLGEGLLSKERNSSHTKMVTVLGERKNSLVVYVEFQNQDENAYFYYERMKE